MLHSRVVNDFGDLGITISGSDKQRDIQFGEGVRKRFQVAKPKSDLASCFVVLAPLGWANDEDGNHFFRGFTSVK